MFNAVNVTFLSILNNKQGLSRTAIAPNQWYVSSSLDWDYNPDSRLLELDAGYYRYWEWCIFVKNKIIEIISQYL